MADAYLDEVTNHLQKSYNTIMKKLEQASDEGPDGVAILTGGEAMFLQRLMIDNAGWKRRL